MHLSQIMLIVLIKELELNGSVISSKSTMTVLEIIFDSTMKWTEHIKLMREPMINHDRSNVECRLAADDCQLH